MVTSTKIALTIEYEGTRYHGFQLQSNLPTIQGEIEKALWKLTGEKIRVTGASRTDTGVHAKGQVASFRTISTLPLQTFVKGLNYYLPDDIAVKEAFSINDNFSVRHSAISREYNYYILNSPTRSPIRREFTYRVNGYLDIEAMNRAWQALIGKHDFASFVTRTEVETKSTVRNVLQVKVARVGDLLVVKMVASSFLPHQVRNTVGALIRVGLGKLTVDEFYSIVEERRYGLAWPTAPPHGLCLMQVNYTNPLGDIS